MLKLKLQHFGHLMWRAESLDSDAGKEWRQEEKGMTENQMVGWHHWPKGHEFEQAPGDGEGQGSLACCSPWGHKGSNMTEWTTAEGEWQLEEEEGMGCFLFASDSWAQPHSSAFSDYSFHLPSSTPTTSSMYALSHTHSIQAAPFSRVGFSSQKHFSKSLGSDNSILFPLSLQSWGWYLLPAVYYFCTNSVLLFLSPFSETRLIYPVQFSRSVVSDSLPPRELQHARLLCPSSTPWAYSNSCPSRWWCHPTISSSFISFSHLQSFPASGSFAMSWFFTSGGQSIGVSASASVLPMNIQDWFPLGLTGLILHSFDHTDLCWQSDVSAF